MVEPRLVENIAAALHDSCRTLTPTFTATLARCELLWESNSDVTLSVRQFAPQYPPAKGASARAPSR